VTWELRQRQAREAAKKFGRAIAQSDCHAARKHKTAYIKAVSQLRDLVGARHVEKFERGTTKMGEKLERCYISHDYGPGGPGAPRGGGRR